MMSGPMTEPPLLFGWGSLSGVNVKRIRELNLPKKKQSILPPKDNIITQFLLLEIRIRSRVPRAANVWVLPRHFHSVSAAGMYR